MSSLAAAALALSTSADTDASNSEALADAELAAAEASAFAEATADSAADAIAEGGEPEKEAVLGGVGRGLTLVELPLPLSVLHDTRAAALVVAASTARTAVMDRRRRDAGFFPEGPALIQTSPCIYPKALAQ
jgi:hypothetical protein